MKYCPRKTIESKQFEGVSFTLKPMSAGRRIELDLQLADFTEKMRENWGKVQLLRERLAKLPEDESDAQITSELMARSRESDRLVNHIKRPILLRWGLDEIAGLEIEGHEGPITADVLMASGPFELYNEIAEAIDTEAGLTPEAIKNLQSRITSGALEDTATTSTTASAASEAESTSSGTAPATSPSL